jgi:nucleotide-binding universal stress UspA family protein
MSIFPTTILLATDGSAQAQLAARTAADLAQRTDSELHVVTVGAGVPISATTSPAHFEDVLRENRRQAEEVLEQQVKSIEESGVSLMRRTLEKGEPRRR